MQKRGAIHFQQAYARGKMLDNSGWTKYLPRNGTPSDIDRITITDTNGNIMSIDNVPVLDDSGSILYFEFSSSEKAWQGLKRGQHLLYQNLVRAARGNAIAVLGYHQTPLDQEIDTVNNIISFHIMYWTEEDGIVYPTAPIKGNELWIKFVSNYKQFIRTYA
jgi:hypothetical protein